MFLFTTPPANGGRDAQAAPARAASAPGGGAGGPVVEAIREGAQRSGASFDYLLATAQRESALDPRAKNGGSSATGLFQFIEQTWLGTLKSEGARLGLGDYAAAISARGDGTYGVGDSGQRQAILVLRNDAGISAAMAGALTQRNRSALAADLGRDPTRGELYAAHVMGARGASELIQTAASEPTRAAASDFPEAAAANRAIFYDRGGRARGAAEVVANLGASQGAGQDQPLATGAPATGRTHTGAAAPASGADAPLAYARSDGPALHSLFQTEGRRGPISEGVARLWQTRGAAPVATTLSYFPRSSDAAARTDAAAESTAGPSATPASADVATNASTNVAAALSNPPLPPPRPDDLPGALPRTAAAPGRIATRAPLDLAAAARRAGR